MFRVAEFTAWEQPSHIWIPSPVRHAETMKVSLLKMTVTGKRGMYKRVIFRLKRKFLFQNCISELHEYVPPSSFSYIININCPFSRKCKNIPSLEATSSIQSTLTYLHTSTSYFIRVNINVAGIVI
jgi:hypothetical protein